MNITQDLITLIEQAAQKGNKIKTQDTLKIIEAYRKVALDKRLIDKILQLILVFSKQENHINKLSTREHQILNLIGLGFKSREMAGMLDISIDTVSTHRKNIIKKLQISGTGQLQNFAFEYLQKKP